MTKILLFTLRKGGIGKTTLSTNQAILFAQKGRTLLIDLDPQANVITQFGYDPYKGSFKTIENLAKGDCKLENCIVTSKNHGVENLDIIPANFMLKDYYEDKPKQPYKSILRQISLLKKSNKYDYIIIDTNPDWNELISFIIQISDAVCIPFIPEPNANWATLEFINEILPSIRDLGHDTKAFIIPNRFKIKKRKGEIIEDRAYQFVMELQKQINKTKDNNIFVAPAINNSEQYANAVAFDKKPLVFVKGIKAYNNPRKQQKELNNFISERI